MINVYGSNGIIVDSFNSAAPYNPGSPSSGLVRYNNNTFEVYDGYIWHPIHTSGSIRLDPNYQQVLEWALKRQREEQEILELAETSPVIQDLVNQIKEKQDQLEMVKVLLKKEEPIGSK